MKIIIGLSEEEGKKLEPIYPFVDPFGPIQPIEIVFDDKNYGVIVVDTYKPTADK